MLRHFKFICHFQFTVCYIILILLLRHFEFTATYFEFTVAFIKGFQDWNDAFNSDVHSRPYDRQPD